MKRKGFAIWKGSGKEGSGTVSTETKVVDNASYTYASRFESGEGTNPEELIGAAHAGCYSMKLSFVLGSKGFTPDEIRTECAVTIESGTITNSDLTVTAKVPGISKEEFQTLAEEAKNTCPVSKVLNAKISLTATLA